MRAALLAVVIALAPRLAAAAPPAPPGSAAAELARLSLPKDNWDAMMSDVVAQVRERVEASFREQGKAPPPGTADAVAASMAEVMPTYQEMLDLQAGLLAKHYTAQEIGQLAAFYRTPLGRKSIQVQPAVLRDVNAYMGTRLVDRMPQAMERLQQRLASPGASPARP